MAKVVLKELGNGCIINTSHLLNQDGYFRKSINGKHKMYHRHVWELHNGMEVPEGKEIHHECHNRNCQNIEHLSLIGKIEHTILTNKERYSVRAEKIKEYLRDNETETAISISKRFKVSFSTICNYRRAMVN